MIWEASEDGEAAVGHEGWKIESKLFETSRHHRSEEGRTSLEQLELTVELNGCNHIRFHHLMRGFGCGCGCGCGCGAWYGSLV
jgi:hypothetical protein